MIVFVHFDFRVAFGEGATAGHIRLVNLIDVTGAVITPTRRLYWLFHDADPFGLNDESYHRELALLCSLGGRLLPLVSLVFDLFGPLKCLAVQINLFKHFMQFTC